MSLVMAGLGFVAFLSAAMLALDVGMIMVARSQAQNAADSGALAGAVALVFDDFDDRSENGAAVQNAITAATSASNGVMNATASVQPADVTFPAIERVRVRVHRTAARGNPLLPFIAPLFGIDEVDMGAVATAEAIPADAATCIKPWAIPDKWDEQQTPAWDETDTFDLYDKKKNPLPNPDIYIPVDEDGYTGYDQSRQGIDYGRQVLLKAGSPHDAINSSHFYPIALPGGTGARWYEDNIDECWPDVAEIGDLIDVEPGNMTGPTRQGTRELIAKDPNARWDPVNKVIVSEMKPSPRVVVLPVFNPKQYEEGREHGRLAIEVANFVGFFIEDMVGNDVLGRVVPMTGLLRGDGPGPAGAFLRVIRLVE